MFEDKDDVLPSFYVPNGYSDIWRPWIDSRH